MAAGPRDLLRRMHEQLSRVRGMAGALLFEAGRARDTGVMTAEHYEYLEDRISVMTNALSRAQRICARYPLYPAGTYEEIVADRKAYAATDESY